MRTALILLAAALISPPSDAALIHEYVFDTGAEDSVGAVDGTLFNGAQVSNGFLVLDGIDDYVEFGEHLIPTSGSYTVALWAKQTAPQSGQYVELISQGFSGGPGYYIGHDPSGIIRAGDTWRNTGVAFPSDGNLHLFVVVVDASSDQSFLYVDEHLKATRGSAITTTDEGNHTRLGRQFDVGSPNKEWFHGMLDRVQIYDEALDASDVRQLIVIFSDGFE